LIECKQRNPHINWLFLPDINRADMSSVSVGWTLRAIDNFHKGFFPPNLSINFDYNGPFCYKGVEIDISKGEVDDKELKHGIEQLQYALPRLLTENITFHANTNFDEDNIPFLFCPILLTTAKLHILKSRTKIEDVKRASSLKDISKSVPYLFIYTDCSPDFITHCKKECAHLEKSLGKKVKEISEYRESHGEYDFELPFNFAKSLARGGNHNIFTQFIVCSLDNFPMLIRRIKKETTYLVKNITPARERRDLDLKSD
jgi:hypothetical protein